MNGSIQVDLDELYHFATMLGQSSDALRLNDQRPDGGQVGNGEVAGALDHFFQNWNYKRGDLVDRLRKLSAGVTGAATAYQEVERELGTAFAPGGGASARSASTTSVADARRNASKLVSFAERDLTNVKGGVDASRFAVQMLKGAKILGNTEVNAKHLFSVSKITTRLHAPAFTSTFGKVTRGVGTAAAAAGAGISSFKLGSDLGKGHYGDATRNGIDVVWTIGGVAAPPVAMAKAAWAGGFFIGKGAAWGQEKVFHTQQHTVDYAARTYPTDNIGTRYNGWSGFGNFALDTVHIKNPFRRHQ